MVLHHKSWWCQPPQVSGAGMYVKHALAGAALKVVVVAVAGQLVAGSCAGQVYRANLGVVQQSFEIAVDRGQRQAWHPSLGLVQNLLRQQGPASYRQGLMNRRTLNSHSLHGASVPQTQAQDGACIVAN